MIQCTFEVDVHVSRGKGRCNIVGHLGNAPGMNHAFYTLVVEACSVLVFIVVHNAEEGFDEHRFKKELEDHTSIARGGSDATCLSISDEGGDAAIEIDPRSVGGLH